MEMDWKLFAATFLTIFLAELGDKTQLAAVAASSQSKTTFTIFLAVSSALILASFIGVLAGRVLSDMLNARVISILAGGGFILMGTWILIKALRIN